MIELIHICAGYNGENVLHNIDMRLEPAKITALIGPNGCGKSTLLKSLVRLNPHTSGQILIDGQSIENYNSSELARRIAYLPQNRNVPDISVLKMVLHGRFPYLKYPRKYREEDFAKAREALKWVDMEAFAEQNVNELSGGNQQKVYIAMALAQDTPAILLDEPTTYLDISHQLRMMELARKLAERGKAVVIVLHDLSMALQYADCVAVMSNGEIASYGGPHEVYESGVLEQVFGVKVCRIETESGWKYYYK